MATERRAGARSIRRIEAPLSAQTALHTSEGDARFFLRASQLYATLIVAHYGLVVIGRVPAWTMAIALPVLMARYMVVLHELLHARSERQVDWLTRLWLVQAMVGPVTVGYREFRDFHFRHHAHLLTERDPDRYQIACGPIVAFLHTLTSPEQNVIRWIAQKGLDRSLACFALVRFAIFCGLAWAGGPHFLWFWVPLRLTFGAALFLFSHMLHRRGPEMGAYAILHPPWRRRLTALLFGEVGLHAISNHDVHHADATLSPFHLEDARAEADADRSVMRPKYGVVRGQSA